MGIDRLNTNEPISKSSLFIAREKSLNNIKDASAQLISKKPNTDTFTPSEKDQY